MALALVQIAFGVAVGTLLFRMDWGPALPMVLVVLFCWAAFNYLPTGWTMDALHRLVSFQDHWRAAIPHVLALGAGALGLASLAARRFRFD
jgi:hypothetical protein